MKCSGITVSVPGRALVENLELTLAPGEFVAILGRNGVGKTLTINTMAGLRPIEAGRITLGGEDLARHSRTEVARRLALLPQLVDDVFPATVLDTALIGRHPHIGALRWESPEDYDITMAALVAMDLGGFSQRDVLTLSGGERRRLAIAQVLAQRPDFYLLDEPTNHLDPQHQHDVLSQFRQLADDGACIVASLHDVNLASRYADRCLLLHGDGKWELGDTTSILDDARLSVLYGTGVESVAWRSQTVFVATGESPRQTT